MNVNYSEVIDLTIPITSGTDNVPTGIRNTVPPVSFTLYRRSETDGIQVGYYQTPIHTGTHLDAPKHILADGKTMDEIDLGQWMGMGYCADVSEVKPNEEITVAMLEPYADKIKPGSVLFLYTGWSEKMLGTLEYWNDSPVLSVEAAEWIIKKGVKFLGYDFFQDAGAKGYQTNPKNFLAHRAILGNGGVHVEHLTNLSKVVGTEFFAIGLPLKIKGAEGSPTRVVALR